MNQFFILILTILFPLLSLAEPIVTIACQEPKGFNMEYGASVIDRVQAERDKKPEPKPHFTGPTKDGYLQKPTFIIDSKKKKLTVVWAESDAEQRKEALKSGVQLCCAPRATEANIIVFTPEQISAFEVSQEDVVTMYTFFPKLGTAFFSSQHDDYGGKNTTQLSLFSTCEFSWSGSRQ